jgi:tellurite methyltransferase
LSFCKISKNELLILPKKICNNIFEVMIMKGILASNIVRYRKANGLTQEELGNKLGITFQAVSKWETEQANPDVTILPQLAETLKISVDKLLGYTSPYNDKKYHETVYNKEEYYGGVNPSSECLKVISLLPPSKHLKVLDVCCGEGKNAVFFARCGYEVDAIDITDAGIEKTKQLANNARVHVNAFKADVFDYRLECKYDIIFANKCFHYINPELRDEIIEDYREHTNIGGINAFSVFVTKPFIVDAPDVGPQTYFWLSGQLLLYYNDWLIEDFSEYTIERNASDNPHQHVINQIYARKNS